MKPLGRKYYKDNTGGKHRTKVDGKPDSWWEDCIPPNKTLHRRENSVNVSEALDEYDYEWESLIED